MAAQLTSERVVPLLKDRSRRENAGSKMATLLAQEVQLEEEDELFAEEANDEEFITKPTEDRDLFDSDFANTSSASSDESLDEEGAVAAEERAERKAARNSRILPTGPAVTSRGRPKEASDVFMRPSKRRRLSPGGTSFIGGGSLGERASSRTSTIQFKQNIDERLEAEESKRLDQVSRTKAKQSTAPRGRSITQAELVAEALETEALNRASLQAFYAAEEERKETQARAGRLHRTIGPTISFISQGFRVEEVTPQTGEDDLQAPRLCRNFVNLRDMDMSTVHVLGAVLGYHVDWMQPLHQQRGRRVAKCAITGEHARYRDPKSGAPYASRQAYLQLQQVGKHAFAFDEGLACFPGGALTD